jgi:hypothetical protein
MDIGCPVSGDPTAPEVRGHAVPCSHILIKKHILMLDSSFSVAALVACFSANLPIALAKSDGKFDIIQDEKFSQKYSS